MRFHVFADKSTGRIRGWCSVSRQTIRLQEVRDNETVVEVSRPVNLATDHYVDLQTGALSKEPLS